MRDKKHESPRDGTLRIHHRRAGTYQPKDSLGLSCILQVNDTNETNTSYTRRRTSLTIPQDNIGISCLPNKDSSELPEKSALELDIAELASIKDINLNQQYTYPTRILENLWNDRDSKKQLKKESGNEQRPMGISNIRRPKNETTKTRKSILPKDNISHCCKLLQKPTASRSSIKSLEKNSKSVCTKPIESGTNLKIKQHKKK